MHAFQQASAVLSFTSSNLNLTMTSSNSESEPIRKSKHNIVMVLSNRLSQFFDLMLMHWQGTMTFGKESTPGARVHDLKDITAMLDIFQAHGHSEVSFIISSRLRLTFARLIRRESTPTGRAKNTSERSTGKNAA
jgi:hypothetical protein